MFHICKHGPQIEKLYNSGPKTIKILIKATSWPNNVVITLLPYRDIPTTLLQHCVNMMCLLRISTESILKNLARKRNQS